MEERLGRRGGGGEVKEDERRRTRRGGEEVCEERWCGPTWNMEAAWQVSIMKKISLYLLFTHICWKASASSMLVISSESCE